MAQIKKITVSLTEDITLAEGYQFAWVKNTGSETLYISGDHSVLNAEGQIFDKDVATIKAGEATMVTIPHGILYCYSESSTTAEVHAQGIPTCPFKLAQKSGGGSGTSASIYRTTTALTDGATTNPIQVDGNDVTAVSGDFAVYNTQEFLFDGTQWNLLGDRVGLGDLAYKSSATGTAVTNVVYDSTNERLVIELGTVTVS